MMFSSELLVIGYIAGTNTMRINVVFLQKKSTVEIVCSRNMHTLHPIYTCIDDDDDEIRISFKSNNRYLGIKNSDTQFGE